MALTIIALFWFIHTCVYCCKREFLRPILDLWPGSLVGSNKPHMKLWPDLLVISNTIFGVGGLYVLIRNLLMEEVCAHMCNILFLRRGSVEMVQYVKYLVKSDIPNGVYPETIPRLLKKWYNTKWLPTLIHNQSKT